MRTICVSQRGGTTPGVWGTDPLEQTISLVEEDINVVAGGRSAPTLIGPKPGPTERAFEAGGVTAYDISQSTC